MRSGFLDFDGYEKVLAELPDSLKSMFVVAYHIGNRKGALLKLKWRQVDFTAAWFASCRCVIASRLHWRRQSMEIWANGCDARRHIVTSTFQNVSLCFYGTQSIARSILISRVGMVGEEANRDHVSGGSIIPGRPR